MTREKNQISVELREDAGTANSRRHRRNGLIPAVVYGHGMKPKHLLLNAIEWQNMLRQSAHIVELKPEKGKLINALIKDIQHDYLSNKTLHIDFQEVKMDELITTEVALHSHGTPAGQSHGGVLEQLIHELEVRCTPNNMPESIEVDVSGIQLNDSLYVSDITPPEGVELVNDPEQAIFHVAEPRLEEAPEEAAEGEAGAEEPEVIGASESDDENEEEN